jgi:hypothetical protein
VPAPDCLVDLGDRHSDVQVSARQAPQRSQDVDQVASTHQPIVADDPQREVAIVESGALLSAGRIAMTPEAFELFAQSLAPTERVALAGDWSAREIARILGTRNEQSSEPRRAKNRRQPGRRGAIWGAK